MKKNKSTIFYMGITGVFLLLMYWIVQIGKDLETVKSQVVKSSPPAQDFWQSATGIFSNNAGNPLSVLLLQIITIIIAARTFGYLFNKIRQPSVIGEIVAGIVLGPSLLGLLFPAYSSFLFPKTSLPVLQLFSQLGLLFFMFVIGMELDLKLVKQKARAAVIISHASIIIPYALGMGLAYFIYREYAPANINFISFSLFIGIAMSITAFPVLARILQERGMTSTRIGSMALACAAADDITAWCILAAVISIVNAGSSFSALITICLTTGYVIAMLTIIKPLLERIAKKYAQTDVLSLSVVALMFGILLVSAYITEIIGIHALFGAFLAGVIMPSSLSFRRVLMGKVEHVSLGLLLPLFFAFSGLRTEIGLLNTTHAWLICAAITGIAIVGKFGGSMLAAKFVGESWKDSLTIGALINTRGLMELIVLNIGFELGVLNAELFTMMVIMALVTTFLTGPALDLINHFAPASIKQDYKRSRNIETSD